MASASKELIDRFVYELRDESAFVEDEKKMLSAERSRGWI